MIDVLRSSKVLFALGRPGCGKSTAVRHIQALLEGEKYGNWYVPRIKDYDILYSMFDQERRAGKDFKRRFSPVMVKNDVRGFDVIDFTVLDEALEKTTQAMVKHLIKFSSSPDQKKLITVEFARDNYKDVFEKLVTCLDKELEPNKGRDLLQQSFFLFTEAPLKDCMQRIHERVKSPIKEDNHLISDDILRSYYEDDGVDYIRGDLKKDYHIDQEQIKIFENKGSQDVFLQGVASFLNETVLGKIPVW